jgi:hypothetical protein
MRTYFNFASHYDRRAPKWLFWCALLFSAGCDRTQSPEVTVIPSPTPPVKAAAQFVDVTARSGVRFQHVTGAFGARLMPETMGAGIAFLDYDGDGDQDLYCVNSRNWTDAEVRSYENAEWSSKEVEVFRRAHPGKPLRRIIPANRPRGRHSGVLYRNNGSAVFTDVTAGSGLDVELYGMGATVADYDNDGRVDLFLTGWDRSVLFHNEGNGKFRDVTKVSGVTNDGWGTSAAWLDYDRDGRLDLFVCNYLVWSPSKDLFYSYDGLRKSQIGPRFYQGQDNNLFRNLGNGKFANVSKTSGIRPPGKPPRGDTKMNGKSLGVAVFDYNGDLWPDLVVANDMERNYLLVNRQDGTFEEKAREAGIAYSEEGYARAGMGIDSGDLDGMGRDSVMIGNFSFDRLGLYRNNEGTFRDIATHNAVGAVSWSFLTFGLSLVDIDNDGWLDAFVANGHLQDDISKVNPSTTYEQRPLLFYNRGQGDMVEIGEKSGDVMRRPIVARGLAHADFDLDGDSDIALSRSGGTAMLLRNEGGNGNNSLRVTLLGTKSNRDGIGAHIEAKIGDRVLRRMVKSGSSYCSASELPVTLGAGDRSKIEDLKIQWPSGAVTQLQNVPANQAITVREGAGIIAKRPVRSNASP